uniref:Putative F-box protein At2g33190 n=1 Tax=Anthurium amnicola TaxID=1678845 RepID=A0A1D1YHY8_9ARAE
MREREMDGGGGGEHRWRDWAGLPGELLASIRERLLVDDFVRFAAVCTGWRHSGPAKPAPQLPWLMVPPHSSGITCRFISPSDGKIYFVAVPELRGTRCVGSCHGWVATVSRASLEMSLVNPLTRARIPLPSLTTAPEITAVCEEGDDRVTQYRFRATGGISNLFRVEAAHGTIEKVVMSCNPTHAACKIAAGFDYFFPPASVAVGGEKWTVTNRACLMRDIVYHEGEGVFYGVDFTNRVLRWGVDDVGVLEYCRCLDFPGSGDKRHWKRHLVVHRPSGDLLLVFFDLASARSSQEVAPGRILKEMGAVRIFGYKLGGSAGSWQPLERLGGCSVFLGKNMSICLSAQEVPELRTDCVFFIDQSYTHVGRKPQRTHGSWVYDLKEGVWEPYFYRAWRNSHEAPLWFTPNIS